jgi:hypothetical protein
MLCSRTSAFSRSVLVLRSTPARSYCVTVIVTEPLALSVVSVPVIVALPVAPTTVPVAPLVMLMTLGLLEVKVVEAVLSVPLSVAVKVIVLLAPEVARLMGLAGLEVIVSAPELDCPSVMLALPETTLPLEDCAAA